MFLDHTQRRSTVVRTPLDEWSARRRDLYLTTHDTHNRQISMPPVGFEPTISAGVRPQAAHLLFFFYIYDTSSLKVNNLTLILLTWRKWWAPNNASKQQMEFNSGFKGLICLNCMMLLPTSKIFCCRDPSTGRKTCNIPSTSLRSGIVTVSLGPVRQLDLMFQTSDYRV